MKLRVLCYTLSMSYWPEPKVIKGETTYYVHKNHGTTTTNGEPKRLGVAGKKVVTETKTLKHGLLYLLLDLNSKSTWAVATCGKLCYFPHRVQVLTSYKFSPLFCVKIKYGWTKMWWKPWSYLGFKKGGTNKFGD